MDRDRRWDRIKLAYDAIVHAEGRSAPDAAEAVGGVATRADETDEFVEPTVIGDYDGMADGDAVLHFNFRPDRARQLVRALGEPDFDEFARGRAPRISLTTLTEYREGWDYPVAFPPHGPRGDAGRGDRRGRGERQLHVAETEKYAHVTYFFNGGREAEWEGEERRLVPSPRDVPTYDQKPEMSAASGGRRLPRALERRRLPVRDHQLRQPGHGRPHRRHPGGGRRGRDRRRLPRRGGRGGPRSGGACIVTADHGNADHMLEPDGSPNTAHSTNPVPLDRHRRGRRRSATAGSSPTSPRRRSPCSGSSSPPR